MEAGRTSSRRSEGARSAGGLPSSCCYNPLLKEAAQERFRIVSRSIFDREWLDHIRARGGEPVEALWRGKQGDLSAIFPSFHDCRAGVQIAKKKFEIDIACLRPDLIIRKHSYPDEFRGAGLENDRDRCADARVRMRDDAEDEEAARNTHRRVGSFCFGEDNRSSRARMASSTKAARPSNLRSR